jgi:hypothetical protein
MNRKPIHDYPSSESGQKSMSKYRNSHLLLREGRSKSAFAFNEDVGGPSQNHASDTTASSVTARNPVRSSN